jgi:hypothetical protein
MSSSSQINPYEAPKVAIDGAPGAGQGAWSHAGQLVTSSVAVLPDRCVRCNRPAEGYQLRRTLYWHSPWLYLLVVQIWIYVIVGLIMRKKAIVTHGLCPEHRASRATWLWISWGILLAGLVAAPALAIALDSGGPMMGMVVGIVVAAFTFRFKVATLRPARINREYAYLVGAGDEFLATLPRFQS